jgi:hypothetical protein
MRDVGIAWQPAQRTWAIADPLLAAYAREHAQPWALRRRSFPQPAQAAQRPFQALNPLKCLSIHGVQLRPLTVGTFQKEPIRRAFVRSGIR